MLPPEYSGFFLLLKKKGIINIGQVKRQLFINYIDQYPRNEFIILKEEGELVEDRVDSLKKLLPHKFHHSLTHLLIPCICINGAPKRDSLA